MSNHTAEFEEWNGDPKLSFQRWQVALVIKDLKPRTTEEISELVGFDPTKCLLDERRGAKNFERRGNNKWRLKEHALRVMEMEVAPATKHRKPPKKRAKRVKKKLKIT